MRNSAAIEASRSLFENGYARQVRVLRWPKVRTRAGYPVALMANSAVRLKHAPANKAVFVSRRGGVSTWDAGGCPPFRPSQSNFIGFRVST